MEKKIEKKHDCRMGIKWNSLADDGFHCWAINLLYMGRIK